MTEIARLIVEQNLRIEARKNEFTDAATAFAKLFSPNENGTIEIKKDALLNLHQKSKVYFSCVESCIVEGCVAGFFEHQPWLDDMVLSAEKVLKRVPMLYTQFRKYRTELGLTSDAFEPSGNMFQNMQGILALCQPEKAKKLKQQFIEANLLGDGFDKPLKPKPVKPEKNNPWRAGTFYLFAYAVIIGGIIAICKYVPSLAVLPAIIALILLVIVVGALQLKNDGQLKEKSFVELMKLVVGRLVLFKSFKGAKKDEPKE